MKEFSSSQKRKCRKWVIKRLKSRGCYYVDGKAVGNLNNATLFAKYQSIFASNHKLDFLKLKTRIVKYSETGFVYVVGNLESRICKIGFSTMPERRLPEIQTGCPYRLHIFFIVDGTRTTERALHKKYRRYRVSGEWFSIEGTLKESIYKQITKYDAAQCN